MARSTSTSNSSAAALALVDLSVFHGTPMAQGITDMLPRYLAMLPEGAAFADDTWNAAAWGRREKAVKTLNFARIGNPDLVQLAKIRTLDLRLHKNVAYGAIDNLIAAMAPLGQVLQARVALSCDLCVSLRDLTMRCKHGWASTCKERPKTLSQLDVVV